MRYVAATVVVLVVPWFAAPVARAEFPFGPQQRVSITGQDGNPAFSATRTRTSPTTRRAATATWWCGRASTRRRWDMRSTARSYRDPTNGSVPTSRSPTHRTSSSQPIRRSRTTQRVTSSSWCGRRSTAAAAPRRSTHSDWRPTATSRLNPTFPCRPPGPDWRPSMRRPRTLPTTPLRAPASRFGDPTPRATASTRSTAGCCPGPDLRWAQPSRSRRRDRMTAWLSAPSTRPSRTTRSITASSWPGAATTSWTASARSTRAPTTARERR
jgi:hypothetical protein